MDTSRQSNEEGFRLGCETNLLRIASLVLILVITFVAPVGVYVYVKGNENLRLPTSADAETSSATGQETSSLTIPLVNQEIDLSFLGENTALKMFIIGGVVAVIAVFVIILIVVLRD